MIDNKFAFELAGYTSHERWLEDLKQLKNSGEIVQIKNIFHEEIWFVHPQRF